MYFFLNPKPYVKPIPFWSAVSFPGWSERVFTLFSEAGYGVGLVAPWLPLWVYSKNCFHALGSPPMADSAYRAVTVPRIAKWASMCVPMPKKGRTLCGLVVWAAAFARQFVLGASSNWKMDPWKAASIATKCCWAMMWTLCRWWIKNKSCALSLYIHFTRIMILDPLKRLVLATFRTS